MQQDQNVRTERIVHQSVVCMLVMVGSSYIVLQEMLGVNHVLLNILSITQIVDNVKHPVMHLAPVIVSFILKILW